MTGPSRHVLDFIDLNPWIAEISSEAPLENGRTLLDDAIAAAASQRDLGRLAPFLDSAAFVDARRRAQEARRNGGLDRWNVWAQRMLDLRAAAAAEDALLRTLWDAAATVRYDAGTGVPPRFASGGLFSNILAPGDLEIAGLTFDDIVDFDSSRILGRLRIEAATFDEDCSWSQAQFVGGSEIRHCAFGGRSDFGGAFWRSDARFEDVVFSGPAMFREATVVGVAAFAGVRFEEDAGFHQARFENGIEFHNCDFKGPASFQQSSFSAPPVFDNVTFDAALHTDQGSSRRVRFPALDRATPGQASRGRPRRDGAA